MPAFDPRLTPARADLAAKHLEGKVQAARFVTGVAYQVIAPQAPLRLAPRPDAPLASEALSGERVVIYESDAEGWSWGQLESDRYVGWLPTEALGAPGPRATHRVAALRTLVFPGPSIKLPPLGALPFGATLAVAHVQDRLAITQTRGYVPAAHLAPIRQHECDLVSVAERFLGVPYLWGGKTALGLDCSGLVQVALSACGMPCPRDTDMQEATLGVPVDPGNDLSHLRRGDLIFWTGHVAIVGERGSLVHANAFHMAVAIEPLAEAVARICGDGFKITGVRRIVARCTSF